jgi:hypothetical protein
LSFKFQNFENGEASKKENFLMFTLLVLILPNIKKVEISTRRVVNWHKFQILLHVAVKFRDLLEFVFVPWWQISTRRVVNWHKFQVKNFIVAKKSTRDLLEFVQF